MIDLGATFEAMLTVTSSASDAQQCWAAIVDAGRRSGGLIPEDLVRYRPNEDVEAVAAQLREIMQESPIPSDVNFLYFGLFAAADPNSGEEFAGFYVSGGTSSEVEPRIDSRDDLTYLPSSGLLRSRLLDRIKREALRGGDDYNFYDYALMFGAASLLAKFAARQLQIGKTLVVGFDSGDTAVIS